MALARAIENKTGERPEVIHHGMACSVEKLDRFNPIYMCAANTNTRGDYNPSYLQETKIVKEVLSKMPLGSNLYTFGSNYEASPLANAYIDSKRALRFMYRCRWHRRWIHTTLSNLYLKDFDFILRFPKPCTVPQGTFIEPLQVDAVAARLLTMIEPGEYHIRSQKRALATYISDRGVEVVWTDQVPVEFPIDWDALDRGLLGKQIQI